VTKPESSKNDGSVITPEPKKKRKGVQIGVKLVLYLSGSLVLIFGVLTFLILSAHQNRLKQLMIDSALRISDTIKNSTHHDMLHSEPGEESRNQIKRIINSIGAEKGIERIRIFDKEGRILYSTDEKEISEMLDKNAEACYICHSQDKPLKKLKRDDRWRIFRKADGSRVLGLINPFENEPGCSSTGCHGDPKKIALLGVLDVNMSLKEVDGYIAEDVVQHLVAYLLTMLAVAVVSSIFVVVMVQRPVTQLTEGTRRVARGELGLRLTLNRRDEIGVLAESFNRMSADLKDARDEITNWARTLEKRVAEKTKELRQAQEGIIRVEKMASLGKLAAIVAHEINNPLMGILTYAKLLQRRINDRIAALPEGVEHDFHDCLMYTAIVQTEATRAGEIVKNLLFFAKEASLRLEPSDINQILEKSIMLVNHQMELNSIECITRLDSELPPVRCDASQIQQVVVALLINAVEAIGENGRITVSSERGERNETVILRIADTGIGMDEETKRKIFEPFFSTKESGGGTGLGLAVVHGIVERHGGSVRVESAPGKGTTFAIELHINPPQPEEGMQLPQSSLPGRI